MQETLSVKRDLLNIHDPSKAEFGTYEIYISPQKN